VHTPYNNNVAFLSQASWGRLEMKPKRNKGKGNTKRRKTKGRVRGKQKRKQRSWFRHVDWSPSAPIDS
jgi:hypothetical protein